MNVICGVVKDFLTHLREPILTFRLHNTFMAAIGNVALLYEVFNGAKKLSVEKLLCVWEEECGSLWGGGGGITSSLGQYLVCVIKEERVGNLPNTNHGCISILG